jgi:hypothetical protein
MVHFLVPRSALAAINPLAIVGEARRAGVHGLRITMNDRGASASETRLTCEVVMALRVVQAIERAAVLAADKRDDPLSLDLAVANREATNAIDALMTRSSTAGLAAEPASPRQRSATLGSM